MLPSLLFGKKRDTNACMQATPTSPIFHTWPLGLKTLTIDTENGEGLGHLKPCLSRTNLASPTTSLSPSSSIDTIDSPIEEEKVDDKKEEEEEEQEGGQEEEEDDTYACWGTYGWKRLPRKFPRPLTLLANTTNIKNHRSRLPWCFKRTTPEGGRLVIKEFKAYRHEYFRTSRMDGRLTLQMIYIEKGSPLLAPPRPEMKEMATMVHYKKEGQQARLSRSLSSSSLSSLSSLSCYSFKAVGVADENKDKHVSMNSRTQPQGILGYNKKARFPIDELQFARKSPMELSSSMPEHIFPKFTNGCLEGSPFKKLPLDTMRAVPIYMEDACSK